MTSILRILRLGGVQLWTLFCLSVYAGSQEPWPAKKANDWYAKRGWLVGCNFSPRTAINQLEMWQAETFDPAGIDRELGYAESLGFTSVRVFLHNLLWEQDQQGFLSRMEVFLKIAHKHKIGVMFVVFDACWDPFPKLGKQRDPRPHVHNSGWVQSPGLAVLSHPELHDSLKPYVQGVLRRFRSDSRIDAWDLFNEPDNINRPAYDRFEPANKAEYSLQLLQKTFAWAREVGVRQPLTAGVWMGTWADPAKLSPMERLCLDSSDVISFHNYGPIDEMRKCIENLRRYNRPILCTEYMARPQQSTFSPVLGLLKNERVGAYNWGFVAGKTQTIYPWDSWTRTYDSEPPVWFHDIFRADGTAYRSEEVEYIRRQTGKK